MIPLIIDTGASINIPPFQTDSINTICPMQPTTVKGIVSGLFVEGIVHIRYEFLNYSRGGGPFQLQNLLCIPPRCTIQLFCPWQLGHSTQFPDDDINALAEDPVLTVNRETTTLHYNTFSKLPLLLTLLQVINTT